MMKKVAMVAAAAAMVLPLGLGIIAPTNAGTTTAFAATKKAAKKTTLTLLSTKTLKKTAYHVKSGKADLYSALFAADKSDVTISKKGTLGTKKTVYATKQIVVKTVATKTAKATTLTCVYVKSANGKIKGWIALGDLTKGAAVTAMAKTTKQAPAAKKATAKKAPAKKTPAKKVTAKKAPAKKMPAKKTTAKKALAKKTLKKTTKDAKVAKKAPAKKATMKPAAKKAKTFKLTAKPLTLKKTAFHFKNAAPAYYTGKFAADRAVVTLTKKGLLPASKTFYATKSMTVKSGKKTAKYLYITVGKEKAWVLASTLTAGKFMAAD